MESATLPLSLGGNRRRDRKLVPGLVLVFSGSEATTRAIPLESGTCELGRHAAGSGQLDDRRVSRHHASVAFQGGRCIVTDLGGQNGTAVDGRAIVAHQPTTARRVIRVGDSLLLPHADVGPLLELGVRIVDGFVRGPAVSTLLEDVARAAQTGVTLHICGESGTGKEGVATAFHRRGPRAARAFVPVNCATIPHAIAERLLFGVKRGAYSGAESDAPGFVQEADGGTLFLDEVGELEPQVQAKLLRVLESGEMFPLGASRPRRVDIAFCSATNKDIRALAASGALREDFYFRIGRPSVELPPLRSRHEEIPVLIAHELAKIDPELAPHVSLVEQCLLRPWPGNVRELLREIRDAASAAAAEGNRVAAHHLSPRAGSILGSAMPDAAPASSGGAPARGPVSAGPPPRLMPEVDAELLRRVEAALRDNKQNVAAAARVLGLHRTQLRRLMKRHGIMAGAECGDAGGAGVGADRDAESE